MLCQKKKVIVFHVSIKVANIAKHVCPCNTHFNYQGKIYWSIFLKHVRKLMALKIHAISNTCYKLFINDSTEKKDTCLTITLLKVGNEANCF